MARGGFGETELSMLLAAACCCALGADEVWPRLYSTRPTRTRGCRGDFESDAARAAAVFAAVERAVRPPAIVVVVVVCRGCAVVGGVVERAQQASVAQRVYALPGVDCSVAQCARADSDTFSLLQSIEEDFASLVALFESIDR